ncbi:hypothetical protein GZH47_33670 (plasmid) [Paenibacillus rhizovicinus]|uniref:Uncharacterized protein n=1 Tax=Paenibacillus rhizovicinus TaxID=2704463 RepID=A0A6C0PCM0_9BACL|nr:hypothetical protein [Paenibacillus rhizovicinus]QHW35843.1 hypothetical protein GZH47_33670 [Paenibacillus rhizovicinus]
MELANRYLEINPPRPGHPSEDQIQLIRVAYSKAMLELRMKTRVVTSEYIGEVEEKVEAVIQEIGYGGFIHLDFKYDRSGNIDMDVKFSVDEGGRMIAWS